VNLAERPSGFERGELNVLIAVPWLDNYGNSVLLGNIFKRLKQAGVQATVVGTNPETDPIFLNGVNNYLSFTRDCFYLATCLPEGDPADFLAHIVRSRKIDVLMINGSKLAYESLERLRRENPRLRIVDHLYNTVGHIEANRAHDKLIDFNIVANDEVRKHLIDLGEAENRVKIVHHGIDVEEFKPAPTPRIPRANGEPLTFGFLGRLSEEKRPEYVVEMARRFPEFRFVIAGAGVLRDRLEASIREARAASRVQLVGSVPSAQEFYNSVDAILLPSRIEGLPLVLLEAMAFEKPVVAARVGMIGEVIESGRNGFTFPAGDLDAMASALEQISKMSSADLSALGQKARATVTEHFSLRRCADEYLNAFRQVALSSVN
jgi:glycosyltransferase involved in cell wall biosynthesis